MASSYTQKLRSRQERFQRPVSILGYVDNADKYKTMALTANPGRRIVELQTAQALINSPQETQWPRDANGKPTPDEFGRKPFLHPALNGLQGLTEESEARLLNRERLSQIGERYGLDKVTRWNPKKVSKPRNHTLLHKKKGT